MKKSILIISLVLVLIFIGTVNIFASDSLITMNGSTEGKKGETGEFTLKVTSNDIEIGVVSGKVTATTNLNEINCVGLNNWNVTYNKTTGEFNAYKAEGAKNEDIIKISYKIQENATENIRVTVSNLKATTIDYTTNDVGDLTKKITLKTDTPTPEPPSQNNVVENTVIGNTATENTIENKITNTVENKQENKVQNKVENKQENKVVVTKNITDTTTSNKVIPHTGSKLIILPIVLIVVVAIVGYIGCKKYKNI